MRELESVIRSKPQRLSWRWKDLYFVWLKYSFIISFSNSSRLWTLKARSQGSHDTMSSLPFFSAISSMSCSFQGNCCFATRRVDEAGSALVILNSVERLCHTSIRMISCWEYSHCPEDPSYKPLEDSFLAQNDLSVPLYTFL